MKVKVSSQNTQYYLEIIEKREDYEFSKSYILDSEIAKLLNINENYYIRELINKFKGHITPNGVFFTDKNNALKAKDWLGVLLITSILKGDINN